MIEVVDEKGLFFGDIVASRRVPNSDVPQDANFKGTMTAIEAMLELPLKLYIPGHGVSGGREVPEASLKYLNVLTESVRRYYHEGLSDYEMKDKVIKDLSAHQFHEWNNFAEIGRVISYLYQEIEADSF
jgi:glyoxylase-like metal-dependent hydrolase (beta-lactamase superfamily II)